MIIIMGPVGSGKSEQTARLADRLELQTISTSHLLRDHLTPEREAKMKAGDLVDDEEIIELLQPELEKIGADSREFILDGFPRSVPQARWLVKQIKAEHVRFTAVIKLNVSDKTVLARLLARGREDDKEEIIKHRLEMYRGVTNPVVSYLNSEGIRVDEIEGEQNPDDIAHQINEIIRTKHETKDS